MRRALELLNRTGPADPTSGRDSSRQARARREASRFPPGGGADSLTLSPSIVSQVAAVLTPIAYIPPQVSSVLSPVSEVPVKIGAIAVEIALVLPQVAPIGPEGLTIAPKLLPIGIDRLGVPSLQILLELAAFLGGVAPVSGDVPPVPLNVAGVLAHLPAILADVSSVSSDVATVLSDTPGVLPDVPPVLPHVAVRGTAIGREPRRGRLASVLLGDLRFGSSVVSDPLSVDVFCDLGRRGTAGDRARHRHRNCANPLLRARSSHLDTIAHMKPCSRFDFQHPRTRTSIRTHRHRFGNIRV